MDGGARLMPRKGIAMPALMLEASFTQR